MLCVQREIGYLCPMLCSGFTGAKRPEESRFSAVVAFHFIAAYVLCCGVSEEDLCEGTSPSKVAFQMLNFHNCFFFFSLLFFSV